MRIPGAEIMSENEETLFTLFFLSSTFSKAFAMRFDRIPDYVPVQIAQMKKKTFVPQYNFISLQITDKTNSFTYPKTCNGCFPCEW